MERDGRLLRDVRIRRIHNTAIQSIETKRAEIDVFAEVSLLLDINTITDVIEEVRPKAWR